MDYTETLTSDTYVVTYGVNPAQNGMRLDAFIKLHYRRRSREQIKRAIDSGAVTVLRNQSPHLTVGRLKPGTQLVPGDEVRLLSERKPEPEVDFNYKILYEDDALFVIEKPSNLPVHPAGRFFFNTLLVHLKTKGHRTPLRAEQDYFLAHRIDRETSGVLVLAKTSEICAALVKQFAERTTEKTYLAIVHGITKEEFAVDLAMKRAGAASRISMKMIVAGEKDGGQPCRTEFTRIKTMPEGFSLLECRPRTGRQHQIRVHLDAIGHPVVGDKLYGRPESDAIAFYERRYITPELMARLLLPRQALHAHQLRLTHPVTGKRMEFRSELPAELKAFCR